MNRSFNQNNNDDDDNNNNQISLVNAYIDNIGNSQILFQQMIQTMHNQETTIRNLITNGIAPPNSPVSQVPYHPTRRMTPRRQDTIYGRSRPSPMSAAAAAAGQWHSRTTIPRTPPVRTRTSRSSHRTSNTRNNTDLSNVDNMSNLLISMLLPPPRGMDQFMTPVIVHPTREHIDHATELVSFSDIINPPNTTCPIDLHTFTNEEDVTRILYCGHIFTPNDLEIWFTQNVRCPLCRYDIRTYSNVNNNFSINGNSFINEEDEIEEENTYEPAPEPQQQSVPAPEPAPVPEPAPEPRPQSIPLPMEQNIPFSNNGNRPAIPLSELSSEMNNIISNAMSGILRETMSNPDMRMDTSGTYIFETFFPTIFDNQNNN
jgi:hypothetical protein